MWQSPCMSDFLWHSPVLQLQTPVSRAQGSPAPRGILLHPWPRASHGLAKGQSTRQRGEEEHGGRLPSPTSSRDTWEKLG